MCLFVHFTVRQPFPLALALALLLCLLPLHIICTQPGRAAVGSDCELSTWCRTQGKARRECFDLDIEVPLRPGEDKAPALTPDPEIEVVTPKHTSPLLCSSAFVDQSE